MKLIKSEHIQYLKIRDEQFKRRVVKGVAPSEIVEWWACKNNDYYLITSKYWRDKLEQDYLNLFNNEV